MPVDRGSGPDKADGKDAPLVPSDEYLIAGMLGGDAAALNKLMDRYDRLVRYTVFRVSKDRCRRDPQWLESVASATWVGFVQSMQRTADPRPASVRAYLTQVARNQAISALRHVAADGSPASLTDQEGTPLIQVASDEPIESLIRLESLEALRTCLTELDPDDRTMATQLDAITRRRWTEAAEALGLGESTLRSRWERIMHRLRTCVRKRTGRDSFAPDEPGSDW